MKKQIILITLILLSTTAYSQNHHNLQPISFSSVAVGYGNTYGGLGGRFQHNFGSVAIHGGVGYYPAPVEFAEDAILFSAGVKFYVDNSLYFNFQFGSFGIEAQKLSYTSSWYSSSEVTQKTLYGPSILLGRDWIGQTFGLNLAFGASYNMVEIEWTDDMKFLYAMDIGFIIKF